MLDFPKRLFAREACLTANLKEFLQTWLKHHINRSDQRYTAGELRQLDRGAVVFR